VWQYSLGFDDAYVSYAHANLEGSHLRDCSQDHGIKSSGGRNIVRRLHLSIMVTILSTTALLVGSHFGLAGARLSLNLERSTSLDLASRNGTQLSGDVSSCPGSPLRTWMLKYRVNRFILQDTH